MGRLGVVLVLLVNIGSSTAADQEFFVNPGQETYHARTCVFVRADARTVSIATIEARGYSRCELCRPWILKIQSSTAAESAAPNVPASAEGENSTRSFIALPAGTRVHVRVAKDVFARKVKEGDRVELDVSYDVIRDGIVVIPRGARALGRIAATNHRGLRGKPGRIDLELLSATDILGRDVPLGGWTGRIGHKGFDADALDVEDVIAGADPEAYPGLVFVPVIASAFYVAYLFQMGGDAVLARGDGLEAYVKTDVTYDRDQVLDAHQKLLAEWVPPPLWGNARLHIYRFNSTRHRHKVAVHLDDTELPPLPTDQVLVVLVNPGQHVLRTEWWPLDLFLQPDTEYYIRVDGFENFTRVDEEQGIYDMYTLRRIAVDARKKS